MKPVAYQNQKRQYTLNYFIHKTGNLMTLEKNALQKSWKILFNETHESPLVMLIPLFLLGIGAIFSGYFFKGIFIGHHSNEFWQGSIFFLNEIKHDTIPLWFLLTTPVLVLIASFFVPGGPTGAGWTLYPPQAITAGTPGNDTGIILMLISLILFVAGFTMGGLNYIITVLQLRARGMTLMRLPLTIWGIFTATVLAMLAFPALLVGCLMMTLDSLIGTSFFMPAMVSLGEKLDYDGGSPILFQHLFWFFGHPEVYIVALPAFGIVSDLLSVHARKTIFGYRMMVWAIVGIGALSFFVWAHHMYVSGMNPWFGFFFATTTLIIAVPTAIKVYNWI